MAEISIITFGLLTDVQNIRPVVNAQQEPSLVNWKIRQQLIGSMASGNGEQGVKRRPNTNQALDWLAPHLAIQKIFYKEGIKLNRSKTCSHRLCT